MCHDRLHQVFVLHIHEVLGSEIGLWRVKMGTELFKLVVYLLLNAVHRNFVQCFTPSARLDSPTMMARGTVPVAKDVFEFITDHQSRTFEANIRVFNELLIFPANFMKKNWEIDLLLFHIANNVLDASSDIALICKVTSPIAGALLVRGFNVEFVVVIRCGGSRNIRLVVVFVIFKHDRDFGVIRHWEGHVG